MGCKKERKQISWQACALMEDLYEAYKRSLYLVQTHPRARKKFSLPLILSTLFSLSFLLLVFHSLNSLNSLL